jgi:hypothetical protein
LRKDSLAVFSYAEHCGPERRGLLKQREDDYCCSGRLVRFSEIGPNIANIDKMGLCAGKKDNAGYFGLRLPGAGSVRGETWGRVVI